MAYWVNHIMGNSESNFPVESLIDLYNELSNADLEHTDVSLTHESEWCLSAFSSGLLVWANLEGDDEPRYMNKVSKEKIIHLWSLLSKGDKELRR